MFSTEGHDLEKIKLLQKVRNDPWEFSKYIFTKDEADKKTPCKRFPYHLDYIKLYIRIWQKENRLIVPKSRRMKMTWVNLLLVLWDTMFHEGRHNAVVSKKEEDADFLIENRIKYMLENIDPKFPRELLPKWDYTKGYMKFPELDSMMQGFPQGEDQLRQYTLGIIFADELAFWEKANKTYAGSVPTLEGGGKFVGISSPAPGFFKDLCLDRTEKGKENEKVDTTTAEIKRPMKGVEVWKNKENEFTVFQLHYTADPAKRSEAFRKSVQKGMPIRDFKQEYELQWETYEGYPVYVDFKKEVHGTYDRIDPWIGLPLLRGWDFGLLPACIIAQLQEETLVVIKEFTAVNMGIDRFSELILPEINMFFPEWSGRKELWMDFIDPSGFFRKDTDETTCAMILNEKGVDCIAGAVTWEERRTSVEKYLTKFSRAEPCFKINMLECPVLVSGFNGGYRYPESMVELQPGKIRPLKDIHSHPHDALQMITSKIRMINRRAKRRVPNPRYSFTK